MGEQGSTERGGVDGMGLWVLVRLGCIGVGEEKKTEKEKGKKVYSVFFGGGVWFLFCSH